ncbi:MAG TPA: FG-GAP-like repeat-containing protein, partial [Acidobacteriaceae bacterium]|nr:FG-GAP-like repeat-containing protein [Acidobacteriaceae bacterium]
MISHSNVRCRLSGVIPKLVLLALLGSATTAALFAAHNYRSEAIELNNLGSALANQQMLKKAADKFAEAYRLDPSLAIAETNQGIVLFYLGESSEAQRILMRATTQNPNDAHPWYVLGLLYRSTGNNQDAAASFKHALAIDPADSDAHYYLASCELDLHELNQAIAEYRTALQLNPFDASAEFGLAKALQHSGQSPEARVHFARFEHLRNDKIATPLAHTYGEEGKYSKAQDILPKGPEVGAMVPITFTREPVVSTAIHSPSPENKPLGGGACMLRPEAGEPLYLIVPGQGTPAIHVYRNTVRSPGSTRLEEVSSATLGLTASGRGVACAVGDFDNDGRPDLAVAFIDRVVLFRNLGHGKFADVTEKVGIRSLNRPAGLTFVDYDHDGDLDLFVTGRSDGRNAKAGRAPNVLWRNNGNKTFTNWTAQSGLGGEGTSVSATLSDLNNDRAVDLVVTGTGAAPTFFANQREGPFKVSQLFTGAGLPPTLGISVFDFNKDGWMDVAVTHAGAPGVTLWRNVDGKHFERVPLPIHDALRGWGLTAVDIDNDGWIDLAVLIDTAHGPELRVLRNLGPKGFQDVTASLKLDKIKLRNPRSVISADVNSNGAADLIVTQLDRAPVVLRNQGGNRNHSLRIALTGLADNKMAIGTKVEVFSNGNWQKWEVTGASGFLSQGPDEILAGLGSNTHADIVRLLWPTGVPQDELDIGTKKSVSYLELDRRGSSCPTLFAWNGRKYQFISDVIGAGVIGHWVAPRRENTPDPDEWIKVEGTQLQARNGYLSLRFGEPMEEVNFLDQVRLVAVDHPAGTDVYPNERFLSEPPFARRQTILSSAAYAPIGAWDDKGRDVRELLRYRDRNYVKDFTNLPFAGFANRHTLTLDLGEWTPQNPLRLFLHGFIEYFSASSMYAAWQAGLKPMPPYVEAQMPDGTWKRVMDDMGFPAGLPRTIVVDLTGK